ncbi:MAG: sugar-binding transcriptional regulator [Paracoccaceae bacterium]
MARATAKRDQDESLAVRAAWLHYAAGMTQAEVASRLGVTNVKAHRLIMRANQDGMVKVRIDGDIAECVQMEATLSDRFGLKYCQVVPDLEEGGLPLRALGIAGADFLQREIESGGDRLVGIGHGRTLSAAVAQLPRLAATGTRFVSLLGGLTRNFAANPHDVMHRLAEKTGATAYVMPVPFFANTIEDREVLLAQRGVRDVFDLASKADLMFVGIGTAEPEAQLVSSQMIEPAEITEVRARGGMGEMLGHFFDTKGHAVKTGLAARTMSLPLAALRGRRIVALAGGRNKAQAIMAVLNSGLLGGLITDERTARAVIDSTTP